MKKNGLRRQDLKDDLSGEIRDAINVLQPCIHSCRTGRLWRCDPIDMHRLLGWAQVRYGKVGTSFDVSADLLGFWYATTNQGTGAIEKPVGGSENLYAYKLSE